MTDATDAQTPLLPVKRSKTGKIKQNKADVIIIPKAVKSDAGSYEQEKSEPASLELKFLQNQWTDIKQNSKIIRAIDEADHLCKSRRRDVDKFTGANEIWDTILYGYFKAPQMSYNPYVTTSLIKAAVSEQSDSDQHEKKMIQQDTKKDENKEITTIQTTLP
eukprot:236215_1